jgi:hypothetical protein
MNGGLPGVLVAPVNGVPFGAWTQSSFFNSANGTIFTASPVAAVSDLVAGSRIFIAVQLIDTNPIPCGCIWLRVFWGSVASAIILALPTPFVTAKGWSSLVYVFSIASNLSGTTLGSGTQLDLSVDSNFAFDMNPNTQFLLNYNVVKANANNFNFETPAAWCTQPYPVGNMRRLTNDGITLAAFSSGLFTQPPIQ